ncbi:MAG: queuosine precursor transporter [Candidatus Marinimicrobia bacterium]|nr:queuosine precursor transporter [Candidatus Neomarinimicrobiota bacterium]
MSNELVFLIMTIFVLSSSLLAFRLGKVWLYSFIAINIILANIFVTKQFNIFGIAATGGNITYGSIFLSTDLLCEHYSKREGRKAVYIGFFAALFYLGTSQLILLFTPNEYDLAHSSLIRIFSFAPRIIFASLIAYMVSQLNDIWLFHFIKEKTSGRFLWLRNNGSTWVSQLIDSITFNVVAFLGTYPFKIVLQIILSTYILKLIIAAIDTPFIYLSYIVKKKAEPIV